MGSKKKLPADQNEQKGKNQMNNSDKDFITTETKSHASTPKNQTFGSMMDGIIGDVLGTKAEEITKAVTSSDKAPIQQLENLPAELLSQPRFFAVKEDKHPKFAEWQKPENQRGYRDVRGLKGFDTCGHGRAVDYLLIDFDHVLDDAGNFIYPDAERWLNYILQSGDNVFCERSISGHGLHILIAPTAGKFPKVTNAEKNIIYFDKATGAKIELFYLNAARYCFVTGNLFRCEPNATIPHDEDADEIFQQLLNTIARNQPTNETAEKSAPKSSSRHEDTPDYDSFRAHIMLEIIAPEDLGDTDWFAVISACKNIGIDYPTVDEWCSRDKTTKANGKPRYNEQENKSRWDSVKDKSFDIKTLHGKAKRFGYSEADARRQWYELHPELKPSHKRNIAEDTQRELDDAIIWLETLSEEDFSADDAYNPDNIHAVALAQTYGFAAAAEKFFAVIKTAKAQAQSRLKEIETGLTAPLDTDELAELNALANLHLETLRKNVAREVQTLARAQKDFAKQQAEEQSRQKAIKARSEHQARVEENIKTLIELRAEYQKNPSPELAKKMRAIIFNSCDVTTDRYTGEVKAVKTTTDNADLIFTFDPYIDGAIGFDEFQQADVILKAPPWRQNSNDTDAEQSCIGQEWTDRDDAKLRFYLSKHYREFGTVQKVDDAIIRFSDKHSFHPVKDYFRNLPKWDGKKRAEKLFIKFLRVDDTPFAREVTLNWLTAAIARIFHPGCRYQTALVLHGNQKIGKSYILERIGGKWYSAIIDNVDDSHAVDAIQNTWIGEFKEMAGMRKAELNAIKSFIERAADNRRSAYARRTAFILRHCIFAITVNDDHFLNDMTGNRRYLILHCNSPKFSYVTGLTDEYISQVWAEVYQHYNELFKDGFDEKKLELSADAQIQGEEIASNYLRDDGLTGEIQAFIDMKIPHSVIWDLLSKEERRNFFANSGSLSIYGGKDELITRRQARGGRTKTEDIKKINEILSPQNERKLYRKIGDSQIIIYGTEYREHICAAEILNEAFSPNDKRKSMTRIHEILSTTLGDWKAGKRRDHDPAYGCQKKVYYRETQPEDPTTDINPDILTGTDTPTGTDNTTDENHDARREENSPTDINQQFFCNEPPKSSQDDFLGEPLDPNDLPPFLD